MKSDAATDDAGYASNVLIENAQIGFLRQSGDTGGIVIDSRWDTVHHLTMNHISEVGTTYGIDATGSIFHQLHDVSITNWIVQTTGRCFGIDFSDKVMVQHFQCTVSGRFPGVYAFQIRGKHTTLTDGSIACSPGIPACAGGLVDGIADLGTANTIVNITADQLTGYLLRNRLHQEERAENLTAIAMNGRLITLYQHPSESLAAQMRRYIVTLKPNLRILYTAALSRCRILWSRLQS